MRPALVQAYHFSPQLQLQSAIEHMGPGRMDAFVAYSGRTSALPARFTSPCSPLPSPCRPVPFNVGAQITLFLGLSVTLITLPWLTSHPSALLVPAALILLPMPGAALRPALVEGLTMLWRGAAWMIQHRSKPSAGANQQPSKQQQQQQQQQARSNFHAQPMQPSSSTSTQERREAIQPQREQREQMQASSSGHYSRVREQQQQQQQQKQHRSAQQNGSGGSRSVSHPSSRSIAEMPVVEHLNVRNSSLSDADWPSGWEDAPHSFETPRRSSQPHERSSALYQNYSDSEEPPRQAVEREQAEEGVREDLRGAVYSAWPATIGPYSNWPATSGPYSNWPASNPVPYSQWPHSPWPQPVAHAPAPHPTDRHMH
jgi:hypothetical protein